MFINLQNVLKIQITCVYIYIHIIRFSSEFSHKGRKEIKKENKMRKKERIKEQRDKLQFQSPIPKAGGLKAKEHKRGNCFWKLEHRRI